MALLKFKCEDCGHVFEELTAPNKKPPCPVCKGSRVTRHYQGKCSFGGSKPGASGGCSGGSCSCCKGCG